MNKRIWTALFAMILFAAAFLPMHFLQIKQQVLAAPQQAQGKEVEDVDSSGSGTTDKGFVYTRSGNNTAYITGYVGVDKEISVPTKIEVKIPSAASVKYNVTKVSANAFHGKGGITSVILSGGLTSEGTQYGLTTIERRAFAGCPDLEKVELPVTVSSIEDEAFADCVSLKEMKVAEGNQYFKVIEGSLYSYSMQSGTGSFSLLQYAIGKGEKEFVVPEAVKSTLASIAPGAFWGCVTLEKMEVPSTVTSIGTEAFYQCSNLETVEMPESVTSIGTAAFSGCTALKTVTLTDSIKTIPSEMFRECISLETLTLPDSLITIEGRAFYECRSLQSLKVPSMVTSIGEYAFAYCSALSNITIPQRTTRIGSNAFLNSPVTIYCHDGSQAAAYASVNHIMTQRVFTVTFYKDSNFWTLVSSQEVLEGGSAIPPEMESRDGYQMTWVGQYTGVTQDSSVYASWIRVYKVTFVDDYRGKKKTQIVSTGAIAVPPAWTYKGYRLSWSNDSGKRINSAITMDTTFHAVWTNTTTGFVLDQHTKKPAKAGSLMTVGKAEYKVTSADPQNPQVKLIGIADTGTGTDNVGTAGTEGTSSNSSTFSLKVPASVTSGNVFYAVTAIAANSCADNAGLRSVTIGANVKKIGSKAFSNCTNLKEIRIRSKVVSTMGQKAFDGIHKKAKFYSFYSKMGKYRKMLKKAGVKKPKLYRLT